MGSEDVRSGLMVSGVRTTRRRKKRFQQAQDGQSEVNGKAQGISAGGMPEGEGEEAQKTGLFVVSATEFVKALGLGLVFSLLQVDFSNNVMFARLAQLDQTVSVVMEGAAVAAFCVAIVVCWRFSDRVALLPRRRTYMAGSAFLAAIAAVRSALRVLGLQAWQMLIPVEVFTGVTYAVILILWVTDIWVLQRRAAVRVVFLSLCIATASTALIAIVPTQAFRYLAMAAFLALSAFSYLAARANVADGQFVSREATRQNLKFDMRTSESLFVMTLAYGFASCMAAGLGDACFVVIAVSFATAAVVVAVGMVILGDRGVLLSTIFRWTYPVLALGFVALPFASGFFLHACVTLVLATCFTCLMSLLVTLVQLKYRFEVQPAYACARILIPVALGTFVGVAAAIVEYRVAADAGGVALTVISMLIVVLLSVSTAVAPYGIDMLTMPIEPEREPDDAEDASRSAHAWKSACEQIAAEGGLTPREVDVFMLLAKGRNAKVIERELFISVYTIKGHNNNIYRKLGVKSQQALIDLVEDRRREIWKPEEQIE